MNYYEVLGVSADATAQQIKEAYRREAMKWHPDRHEGAQAKVEATRRFKEIAEAYRHLRDPVARAAYDQRRQQEAHTHAGARQSDQAGQQRREEWTNTGGQQQSQQNAQRDQSGHSAPDFDEETMSGEEANNMFFEQMVDLAFELAGRGFPQENIVKALIALGCPESMARAVATLAAQRGRASSDGLGERTSARDTPALENLDEATWEEAAPYYEAAILGGVEKRKITEKEYEIIRNKRKSRTNKLIGIGAFVALIITVAFFVGKIERDVAFGLILFAESMIIFLIVLARKFFLGPRKKIFFEEKNRRYYMEAFERLHSDKKWVFSSQFFNWHAAYFNMFWLGYRKAVLFSFFLVVGGGIFNILNMTFFSLDESILLGYILGIGFFVVYGFFANWIYFRFIQSKIRPALENENRKKQFFVLRKKGGVNIFGWIFPAILFYIINIPVIEIQKERIENKAKAEAQARAEKIAIEEAARKAEQEAAEQYAQQDEVAKRAQQEAAKRQASYERENLIRQIEAKFPELNPRSPHHNANAVSWVVERKVAYENQGFTSNNALKKAIQDYELEIKKLNRYSKSIDSGIITNQSSSGNYSGTGELVSLNFINIEIKALLQILSDFSRLHIKQDDEVTGSVSIRVKDVPWDEALSKIMYAKNLKIIKTGSTTLYVYPGYMSDDLARSRAINKGFNS